MRIVFMGTPDFALYSLTELYNAKHNIVAVVTQPDKPSNRGAVIFSPIKKFAIDHNISVLQYEKISKEGVDDLKALNADVIITAAYGQILSKEILSLPRYGVLNVHASLLPKYRGSSPIQWAVINGEKMTGVTIMQTAEGLDNGDILYVKTVEITKDDTAGTLFDKLGILGAKAIVEALDLLEKNLLVAKKQDERESSYYPMLKKSDGCVDWSKSADEIINLIRGVSPWPGAYSTLGGSILKIHKAEKAGDIDILDKKAGEIVVANKRVNIVCGNGCVTLTDVQFEGKKRISGIDVVNGGKFTNGGILI